MVFWPSARVWLGRIITLAFVTGPVIIFLLERFSLYNRPAESVIMQELAQVDGVFDGTEASKITWVESAFDIVEQNDVDFQNDIQDVPSKELETPTKEQSLDHENIDETKQGFKNRKTVGYIYIHDSQDGDK